MAVYFCVLIVLGGIFTVRNSNLVQTKKNRDLLFVLAWVLITLVAGLRYQVGTDYMQYSRNYLGYKSQTLMLLEQPALTIVALLSSVIYDDYATWFFLMAAISFIPVAYVIYTNSSALGISTVFFLLLGCWHTSFNVVKQAAAVAVVFLGYRSLVDRRFWQWCIVCLIGAMFHITAILMIPVYFLVGPKFSWTRVLLIIVTGYIISVSYESLFDTMKFLSDSMSESTTSSYGSEQLNSLRVLVNCAPVILATALIRFYDLQDKQFCTLYNMSVLNAVLNVATMNSAYLNRFATYTLVFNVLFIPYLSKPFKKSSRIIVWIVLLLLYMAFWAYDLYKCSDTVNFQWIFSR